MSKRPDESQRPDPNYRVYRSGQESGRGGATEAARARQRAARSGSAGSGSGSAGAGSGSAGSGSPPSYRTYRSTPQGLISRLRGESEPEVGARIAELERRPGRSGAAGGPPGRGGRALRGPRIGSFTWLRALKYLVLVVIAWLVLSCVLFFISAENHAGNLPKGLQASLTSSGGPMLFSPQNVLVIGLDSRPTSGYSSHEGGANHDEADANTDTLMIWRVGGGVSRRLSIPRDTLVNIPGVGESKINAAWSTAGGGSPATTVKVVERLTGVQINHVIIVDLGNFVKFVDDIGGVTVKTPKICSEISGGAANGGYTLNLKPGTHHLTGEEAMTLARTRENSCNPAYNDIDREKMQQEVLNGMKGQLISAHAFFHLPWAAWDAPGAIQTDMGPITLGELFVSSEIGGSAAPQTLSESGSTYNGEDVLIPNAANVRDQVRKLMNG